MPRRRRAAASPLLHPPARLDADAAPSSLSPTWYGPVAGHFFFSFTIELYIYYLFLLVNINYNLIIEIFLLNLIKV